MNASTFVTIGHGVVGILAFGMLMFFYMIFRGVKKVNKKGRKGLKRLKKFNAYFKSLSK